MILQVISLLLHLDLRMATMLGGGLMVMKLMGSQSEKKTPSTTPSYKWSDILYPPKTWPYK